MSNGDFGDIGIFTSTTAQALKQTLDAVANQEEQRNWLANVSQEAPRWLKNTGSGTVTSAVSGEQRFVYQNGNWFLFMPAAHDERPAPAVAAVKRCTCGGESVGGGHSSWCDIG